MLDLLLTRAEQAYHIVIQRAEAIPSDLELRRIKLSDHFVEMMLEAICSIAKHDGEHVLTSRKSDIAEFGELFASVLWQLDSQHEQMQHQLEHFYCSRCRRFYKQGGNYN